MTSKSTYNLIIVGGGPIGLATAFHYKKKNQNASVLIVEKAYVHNQSGSSNGQTRQFRYQYAEKYMTELAYATESYWKELEDFHGDKLINRVGSLWFGEGDAEGSEGQIGPAMENLDELNLPYEKLTNKEIEDRFGFTGLGESEVGLFQPNGGTINVVETIEVLKNLCMDFDVEILEYNEINVIDSTGVHVDNIHIRAEKIVVTAGANSKKLIGPMLNTVVWNLASIHYKVKYESFDLPSWFYFSEQIRYDDKLVEGGFYYGFEKINLEGEWYFRICPAFSSQIETDLNENIVMPLQADVDMTTNWVKKHLGFVSPVPEFISLGQVSLPRESSKKLYLDYTDSSQRIVVCSSGWNFKFIPLLGYIIAMEVLGERHGFDISPFALSTLLQASEGKTTSTRKLPF